MYKRKRTSNSVRRRVRRRTAMRRSSVPRGIPTLSTFRLKQKAFLYNWTRDTSSTNGFWRYLSLNTTFLPGLAEHQNVFDEYKITGIQFELRPNYDAYDYTNVVVNPLQNMGSVHVAVDPASVVAPIGAAGSASLNVFLEQSQNVKTYKPDQVIRFYYKPKVASQVAGGGTTGKLSYASWYKTTDSGIDHRGAHVYLQGHNNGVGIMSFDVFATYYVIFRGNR